MRAVGYRITSVLLTIVLLLSSIVSGTYAWQNISQQVKNEAQNTIAIYMNVELVKLEKLPDGTGTQTPVPGAAFYLYKEDGTQIGGRYITDSEGKIPVQLEPGSYYFEESAPAPGYTFDTDETGQRKVRYPFTVTGAEAETVVVTAYNIPLQGSLSVQKMVQNADASPLTEAQIQQEFAFTVLFSNGGAYSYTVDSGEPQQLTSGGTLTLKHGQQAVFEKLPVGITYTITEQAVPGYTVSGTGHTGTITETGSAAYFVNTYAPIQTGGLTVTKEVVDASSDASADLNKEFAFTAVIGGKEVSFTLKHGESKTFPDLPFGTLYTVTEADYTADGYVANIKTYTGTIAGKETVSLPFVNTYQPQGAFGSLRISKEVVGENPDPDKLFTFEVAFSDGKGYPYSINGGEPVATTGPVITLQLKGGQTARFDGIPEGVTYTVKETDPAGYWQDLSEAGGTIIGDSAYVVFRNRVPEQPLPPATLIVQKHLAGKYPVADANKEFHFTLAVDGVEQQFTLKPEETIEFEIPAGAQYEVREDDYFHDGYALTLENGVGVAQPGQTITVIATNTYIGVEQTEIKGEKTWELGGHTVALPESITVRLKNGDIVVDEVVVTPNEQGVWQYVFTAPKYDADGNEITYTVEELPVVGFIPAYNGFDIVNTYIPPVEIDPPIIEKVVEGANAPQTEFKFLLQGEKGAPMPLNSEGNIKTIVITGSGEAEIGTFSFAEPGVYIYTLSELNTGAEGWTYDNSTVYTLTFTVTLEDGALHASYTLTKAGEAADKARFVNRYAPVEPDTVEISGTKTWNHGDNPNPPESIIVYVYGDGKLAAQRLVTGKDGWKYAFELPKFAEDGHEIIYTVGEAEVPGYTAEIHGYDILNTYDPDLPIDPDPDTPDKPTDPDKPDEPSNPTNPDGPQTGDNTVLWPWIAAMVLSLLAILITLTMEQRSRRRNKGKHFKF